MTGTVRPQLCFQPAPSSAAPSLDPDAEPAPLQHGLLSTGVCRVSGSRAGPSPAGAAAAPGDTGPLRDPCGPSRGHADPPPGARPPAARASGSRVDASPPRSRDH